MYVTKSFFETVITKKKPNANWVWNIPLEKISKPITFSIFYKNSIKKKCCFPIRAKICLEILIFFTDKKVIRRVELSSDKIKNSIINTPITFPVTLLNFNLKPNNVPKKRSFIFAHIFTEYLFYEISLL